MNVANDFGQVLREHAERQPDAVGLIFLQDGDASEARITYRDLDRRARQIAAQLQGIRGNVLLIHPPGLEFIEALFGCFYANKTAIPVYPPDLFNLSRTLPRLQHMIKDARPAAVGTTGMIRARLAEFPDLPGELANLPLVATDVVESNEGDWQPGAREQIAVLQYTSGSTRAPRGVMLTHANLLENSRFIARAFENSPESRAVTWLPPYHDMGLIGGILQPIFVGFPCVLMSPMDFLQRPIRWLRAVSRYRATFSGGPNFAYDLCAKRIRPADCDGLDLSTWRVAFNGAEPVHHATLERFVTAFEPYGFQRKTFAPCYGLAESTLAVTCAPAGTDPTVQRFDSHALSEGSLKPISNRERGVSLVSSGHSADGHRCIIVDSTGRPAPEGQVGEIWVSGPSVARGYWGQPEESEDTFQAQLAEAGDGPFLRTGDLGAMLGRELYVTGRLKDILIIRGRNYYPSDIEATVAESHEALRLGCTVAFTVPVEGQERLVIAQEVSVDRMRDVDSVILAIRQAVTQSSELQVHAVVLLAPRSLHKTSSGKVQRSLCRSLFLERRLEIVAEWSLTPVTVEASPSVSQHV